jgi:uncharacterized protein YfiM (DUF2279 family)
MMAAMTKLLVIGILLLTCKLAFTQSIDTLSSVNSKRLNTFIITASVGYGVTLVGLNQLWYKNTERQSFQFFNDNAEWNQVDKLGHFYSAFYFSYGTSKALKWAGLSEKKSALWGSLTGLAVLIPVEIFDGYSAAYGASYGDLIANAAGSSFFLAQQLHWNEIRIYPKFSFHSTRFSKERPDVLGSDLTSKILKDYNGQTYWLSFDMDKFIKFPTWLNFAAGYGAHEMVYARHQANLEAGYHAYRQYYVGIDFDLTAIQTRSKFLKSTLFVLSMIKLPAPTLELSKKGSRFHLFYF